jgi:hypothetical protein
MEPFKNSRFLIKFKVRDGGGAFGIHRFEQCEESTAGWRKAASTYFVTPDMVIDGKPWQRQLAVGMEALCDELLLILVRRVGMHAEVAEDVINTMLEYIHAGAKLTLAREAS